MYLMDCIQIGLYLQVHAPEPHNRSASEEQVEQLIQVLIIHHSSREHRLETEVEHREYEQHILVEHVTYQVGIPAVSFPPVQKEQRPQKLELTDCVVAGTCSLHAFEA